MRVVVTGGTGSAGSATVPDPPPALSRVRWLACDIAVATPPLAPRAGSSR